MNGQILFLSLFGFGFFAPAVPAGRGLVTMDTTDHSVVSDSFDTSIFKKESSPDAMVDLTDIKEEKIDQEALQRSLVTTNATNATKKLQGLLDGIMNKIKNQPYDTKCAKENVEEICELIEQGADPRTVSAKTQTSVFHIVAAFGSILDLDRLSKALNHASVPDFIDSLDNTPLLTAIEYCQDATFLNALVYTYRFADVDFRYPKTGHSLAHEFVARDRLDCLERLAFIDGAQFDLVDNSGKKPIDLVNKYCDENNAKKIVKFLQSNVKSKKS